jgi:DNA-binding NarL/FixJ family response regulator
MKILVVDDHALVREGLCQVLKGLDESVEVFLAAHCAQAFAVAQAEVDLDLVLLDYHLPDMNGLAALQAFGEKHPELPIVMLSGSDNIEIMRQVLQAGAAGFVSKSAGSEELLGAIDRVLQGDVYLPTELTNNPGGFSNSFLHATSKPPLTNKQEQVLQHLFDGLSNREICQHLNISEETVKSHITAILRHFDVQNRTQAVVAATRFGYRPNPR